MGNDKTFKPTSSMIAAAKRALAWKDQGHPGGTRIGLTRANQIASGRPLSLSTVKRMHSFFSRHAVDRKATGFKTGEEGFPSPGRVAWDLWGGNAGRTWAARISQSSDIVKAETPEPIGNVQFGKGGKQFDPSKVLPRGNPADYAGVTPGHQGYFPQHLPDNASQDKWHSRQPTSDLIRASARLEDRARSEGKAMELITPEKYHNLLASRGVHPDEMALFGVHKEQSDFHPSKGRTAIGWHNEVLNRGVGYATRQFPQDGPVSLGHLSVNTMHNGDQVPYGESLFSISAPHHTFSNNVFPKSYHHMSGNGMLLFWHRFETLPDPEKPNGKTIFTQEVQSDANQGWRKEGDPQAYGRQSWNEKDYAPLTDVLWRSDEDAQRRAGHKENNGEIAHPETYSPNHVVPPFGDNWEEEAVPWMLHDAIVNHGASGIILPPHDPDAGMIHNGEVEQGPDEHIARRYGKTIPDIIKAIHAAWGGDLKERTVSDFVSSKKKSVPEYRNLLQRLPDVSNLVTYNIADEASAHADSIIGDGSAEQVYRLLRLLGRRKDLDPDEMHPQGTTDNPHAITPSAFDMQRLLHLLMMRSRAESPQTDNLEIRMTDPKSGDRINHGPYRLTSPHSLGLEGRATRHRFNENEFSRSYTRWLPNKDLGLDGHAYDLNYLNDHARDHNSVQQSMYNMVLNHLANTKAFGGNNENVDHIDVSVKPHRIASGLGLLDLKDQNGHSYRLDPSILTYKRRYQAYELANLLSQQSRGDADIPMQLASDARRVFGNYKTRYDDKYSQDHTGLPVYHYRFPQEMVDYFQQHKYSPFRGLKRFLRAGDHLRNVVKSAKPRPIIIAIKATPADENVTPVKFGKGGKPFDPSQIVPKGNPNDYGGHTSPFSLSGDPRSDLLRASQRIVDRAKLSGTEHSPLNPSQYHNLLLSRGVDPYEIALHGVHKDQHPTDSLHTPSGWNDIVKNNGLQYITKVHSSNNKYGEAIPNDSAQHGAARKPRLFQYSFTTKVHQKTIPYYEDVLQFGTTHPGKEINQSLFPHSRHHYGGTNDSLMLTHARYEVIPDSKNPGKNIVVIQEVQSDPNQNWRKSASKSSGRRAVETDFAPPEDVFHRNGYERMTIGKERIANGDVKDPANYNSQATVPPFGDQWEEEAVPWILHNAVVRHNASAVMFPHQDWQNGQIGNTDDHVARRNGQTLPSIVNQIQKAWGGNVSQESIDDHLDTEYVPKELYDLLEDVRFQWPIHKLLKTANIGLHKKMHGSTLSNLSDSRDELFNFVTENANIVNSNGEITSRKPVLTDRVIDNITQWLNSRDDTERNDLQIKFIDPDKGQVFSGYIPAIFDWGVRSIKDHIRNDGADSYRVLPHPTSAHNEKSVVVPDGDVDANYIYDYYPELLSFHNRMADQMTQPVQDRYSAHIRDSSPIKQQMTDPNVFQDSGQYDKLLKQLQDLIENNSWEMHTSSPWLDNFFNTNRFVDANGELFTIASPVYKEKISPTDMQRRLSDMNNPGQLSGLPALERLQDMRDDLQKNGLPQQPHATMPLVTYRIPDEMSDFFRTHGYSPFGGIKKFLNASPNLQRLVKGLHNNAKAVVIVKANPENEPNQPSQFGKGGKPFDPSKIIARGEPSDYPGKTIDPSAHHDFQWMGFRPFNPDNSQRLKSSSHHVSLQTIHRSDLLRAVDRIANRSIKQGTANSLITADKYHDLLASRGVHPEEMALHGVHKGQSNIHPAEGRTAIGWAQQARKSPVSYFNIDTHQMPNIAFHDSSPDTRYREIVFHMMPIEHYTWPTDLHQFSTSGAHYRSYGQGLPLHHARLEEEHWPDHGKTWVVQEIQNDVAQKYIRNAQKTKAEVDGVVYDKNNPPTVNHDDFAPLHDVAHQTPEEATERAKLGNRLMRGRHGQLSVVPLLMPPMADTWDTHEVLPWLVASAIDSGATGMTLPHESWENGQIVDKSAIKPHLKRRYGTTLPESLRELHKQWGGILQTSSLKELSGNRYPESRRRAEVEEAFKELDKNPIVGVLEEGGRKLHEKFNDKDNLRGNVTVHKRVDGDLEQHQLDLTDDEVDQVHRELQNEIGDEIGHHNSGYVRVLIPNKNIELSRIWGVRPYGLAENDIRDRIANRSQTKEETEHAHRMSLPERATDLAHASMDAHYGVLNNLSAEIEDHNDWNPDNQIEDDDDMVFEFGWPHQLESTWISPIKSRTLLEINRAPYSVQVKRKVGDIWNARPSTNARQDAYSLMLRLQNKEHPYRESPVMYWKFPPELIDHVTKHGYAPWSGARFGRAFDHLRNVVKSVGKQSVVIMAGSSGRRK